MPPPREVLAAGAGADRGVEAAGVGEASKQTRRDSNCTPRRGGYPEEQRTAADGECCVGSKGARKMLPSASEISKILLSFLKMRWSSPEGLRSR